MTTDERILEDLEVDGQWATYTSLGINSYLHNRNGYGWVVERSDYDISGDPRTLRDDKRLLECLARACDLLNQRDGIITSLDPTSIAHLPFELSEASDKIGGILNGLQNKFGCEVNVLVDTIRTVGDPQLYSVVKLEARVEGK